MFTTYSVFLDASADPRMRSKCRVVNAPMPKHPLNKCIASVCLLAYIIAAKFCDGLSLYGLEKTLKRYGGDISRTSLANWVIRLGGKLEPLVALRAGAIHYSLVETCKANDINPEAYYRYILPRIPEADTVEKWGALLPWNVKAVLQKNSAKKS